MLQVLISMAAFLVAISILVVVHEYGHFWVARRFGIKVLRFSVGFGKPFYRFYDRLGTEYVLSMIPLGGYVSLLGEKGQNVPKADQSMAFATKPVWVRMLVLAAGPFFNLVFAVLAYWAIFVLGVSLLIPLLGPVPKESVAGLAGLKEGQEIVRVMDQPTPSWEAVSVQLLKAMGEDQSIAITLKEPHTGTEAVKHLDLHGDEVDQTRPDWLAQLGLMPLDYRIPILAKVLPGSPAEQAGLLPGDRILSIDAKPMNACSTVIQTIQAHVHGLLTLKILRQGREKHLSIQPLAKAIEAGQKAVGFIGVEFQMPTEIPSGFIRQQRFGVVEAFEKAFMKTVDYSLLTLGTFKKMLQGKISTRHVSGPIMIAKYAGETAVGGFQYFLDFLAMVSISLGVLNLLPIPLLDGGQLLYAFYELCVGRALPAAIQSMGIWLGAGVLISLMTLAFYNDLMALL